MVGHEHYIKKVRKVTNPSINVNRTSDHEWTYFIHLDKKIGFVLVNVGLFCFALF
jgi:hypothetical protein